LTVVSGEIAEFPVLHTPYPAIFHGGSFSVVRSSNSFRTTRAKVTAHSLFQADVTFHEYPRPVSTSINLV